MTDTLELKLSGFADESISPSSFRAKEVAQILESFEVSLLSILERDHPEIDQSKAFVSLVEVQESSLKLKFVANVAALVSAFTVLTSSIKAKNLHNLPDKAIESTKEIHKIAKEKRSKLEYYNLSESSEIPLLEILPDDEIQMPAELRFSGHTSIYAQILRVGGKDPKARIQLLDGRSISVEVNKAIAKQLAKRLYEEVELIGVAEWSMRGERDLIDFKIEKLGDYIESTISEAIKDLAKVIGKSWKDVEDPDKYINDLRKDN